MSQVSLQNITKRFKSVTALADVSFDIHDGEFFVLLGPTGAGKTTTLRIIAGLTKQEEGSVSFDGEVIDTFPPADRDVAFVFQQYSLYPTMTVYDNLAFPLRSPMRKMPEPEIKVRVTEIAAVLRITHLLDRKTAKLSGGEMQRVSIGRAIVRSPRMYLMDEPLSNLDAKLRESLRVELAHLQKTQNSTTLFVTHDQIEALTMADRIGVLDRGALMQVGTPEDIYDRPATVFVAQLVGSPKINLLRVNCSGQDLILQGSEYRVPIQSVCAEPGNGAPVQGIEQGLPPAFILGVRPEDVLLAADGVFAGTIGLVEPLGVETLLHIRVDEQVVICTVPGIAKERLGDLIRFDLNKDRLHLFDPVTGARLNV
jgi:multiple sugar transport system ATP-binding protein